jgi:hypothetical protein
MSSVSDIPSDEEAKRKDACFIEGCRNIGGRESREMQNRGQRVR